MARCLRRSLRKALGIPPRVGVRRSAALDNTLYRVFEHEGRQYVAVASAVPGQRLIRPLRGQGRISGNVRVVLNFDRRTASVDVPYAVRVPTAVKTVVGQAVRQALRDRPAVVAVEDLFHLRGRTKNRRLSRIVSRWARPPCEKG